MNTYTNILNTLQELANPSKATISQGFFKTGIGAYGQGDVFLGITVPLMRNVAKKYWRTTTRTDMETLFKSTIHEHRFVAGELLQFHYTAKDPVYTKEACIHFYLYNLDRCNNRDLIDNTCYTLLGDRLKDKQDRSILYSLATSKQLRRMRAAIVTTIALVRAGQLDDTYALAEILLNYQLQKEPKLEFGGRGGRELTNKAVGWLLRETRYKDAFRLHNFLSIHGENMPRTMLRYAIEKMSDDERKQRLHR